MNQDSLIYYEAMLAAHSLMSHEAREALRRWESENLDGRSRGTSDWPGWENYIGNPPWSGDKS